MKTGTMTACAATAAPVDRGAAAAGQRAGRGQAAAAGPVALGLAKRFERLDANGDGAAHRAEHEATADDRLRRLDADGDGSVTRNDLQGFFRRG